MKGLLRVLAASAFLTAAAPSATAAGFGCRVPGGVEQFHYTWHLRGGLSWVAGLMFPTSGTGNLRTTFPLRGDHVINSALLITSSNARGGFYAYESQMDESGQKTLMTYHSYAWGKKSRKERTVFDYTQRLAHTRKETPEKVWDRVDPMPPQSLRDILTAIFYLRENADTIREPLATSIYSDGSEYPVVFRPSDHQAFTVENRPVAATAFEIVDAPGGKKWPGGVRVWVSDDARRLPLRIEIRQTLAQFQLELQKIDACAASSEESLAR